MLLRYPISILIYLVPAILVSLTFHELAHAYVSYKLGDPTAKNMGRLSLNPLKHLDIFGTIMLLISSFGWAKPVPINPMYYDNRKRGTMLVSIAGPLSNVLLALIFALPKQYISAKYGIPASYQYLPSWDYRAVIFNLSAVFFTINIGLAVFNILPVPPLDGSKILSGILPSNQYYKFLQYENYIGVVFLLVVFAFPGLLSTIMYPFTWVLTTAINIVATPLANLLL